MDINKITEEIKEAMESMDGEEVAVIHNQICVSQVEYAGDSDWEIIGSEECLVDSDGCLIDNDGDAETDMEIIRRDEKNGLYPEKWDVSN